MNSLRTGIFILVGAGLLACSSGSKIYVQGEELIVSTTLVSTSSEMESFIQPYTDSLDAEMNRILGYATENLERNRPEGALGNFMADLSLKYALDQGWVLPEQQPICILNHGGLRSPINQGAIRVGDIYKLMPFDNTLVVVTLDRSALKEIHTYLINSGGEPIAGFRVSQELIDGPSSEVLTIVTTNYLASGGDKMNFFLESKAIMEDAKLLRDIIIEHVSKTDTILPALDQRVSLKEID